MEKQVRSCRVTISLRRIAGFSMIEIHKEIAGSYYFKEFFEICLNSEQGRIIPFAIMRASHIGS